MLGHYCLIYYQLFCSSYVLLCVFSCLKHSIIFNKLLQYWGQEAERSSAFCIAQFGSLPVFYSFIITQHAPLLLQQIQDLH